MIRINKIFVFTVILSLLFILVFNHTTMSQPPPPPSGGADGTGHDLTANQGGAPVGEGIWILLTLAISYGLHSYMRRRENVGGETLQRIVTVETNNSGWEKQDSGLKVFIYNSLRPFLRILHYHKN